MSQTEAEDIAAAYRYALPLFEMERLRYQTLFNPDSPRRRSANTLIHKRGLADHQARTVTTPNNDTLYSMALLDLRAATLELDTPDSGARYYSVALLDAYSNNRVVLSPRHGGTQARRYWIVGPEQHIAPPPGVTLLRLPTVSALLLLRVLVDGPQDLAAATAVQEGFRLQRHDTGAAALPAPPPQEDRAASFLAVVAQALRDNPPPSADAAILPRLARVGLGPLATQPPALPLWEACLPQAQAQLRQLTHSAGEIVQQWSYPPAGMGEFGTRYALRAAVALAGFLALPAWEAQYISAYRDQDDAELHGAHAYRWQLPAGGVPVDAFWSLSLYEREPDGRLFFADNPLQRYAIGDRTPGLRYQPDGSLDLYIQHAPPPEALRSNWLPAPPGAFQLMMRCYHSQAPLLDGRYRFAAVQRLRD